jgi:nucleoside-diphosphate-sugar epimerase
VLKKVLITGGTGYLAQQIAARYLMEDRFQVVLWVHARDDAERAERKRRVAAKFGDDAKRLVVHYGDLQESAPFAGLDPAGIEQIVHTAAVIRFNVDRDTADQVNVRGTRKLLDFARHCTHLERLGFFSSLYASGLAGGTLPEGRFAAKLGHANHYEWSKWAAEELLFTEYPDLPWHILRVGTIIADGVDGVVTQHNAVHNTLKLFFYGLLPMVPGLPDTPLYLATGGFVARAAVDCMKTRGGAPVYHLTHDRSHAVRLGEFLDIAHKEFSRHASFAARRVLKPLYADYESFDMLASSVSRLSGSIVTQALSTVSPFAAQLFVDKDIRADHVQGGVTTATLPDVSTVVQRTCQHLATMGWGGA